MPESNNQTAGINEVNSGTTVAASAVSSSTDGAPAFGVMLGSMAAVIIAFQIMAKFSIDLTELYADNTKQFTLAYLGGEKVNDDGTVTIDFEKSLMAVIRSALIDQGKEEADGLREQARGQWGSAITNGIGLGMSGGSMLYGAYKTSPFEKNSKNLNTLQDDMMNPNFGPKQTAITGQAAAQTPQARQQAIDSQLRDWTDGVFTTGTPTSRMDAIMALRGQNPTTAAQRSQILERIRNQVRSDTDQIGTVNQLTHTRGMFINQATQMMTAIVEAIALGRQAVHKEKAAVEQATAGITTTVEQKFRELLTEFLQKMTKAADEANSLGSSLAHIAATSYRG